MIAIRINMHVLVVIYRNWIIVQLVTVKVLKSVFICQYTLCLKYRCMHVNSFYKLVLSLYFRHSRRNVCRRVHYRTMAAKRRWIHEAFLVWSGSQVFQSWPKLPHGKNCHSTSFCSFSFQVCLILLGLKKYSVCQMP